MTETSTPNFKKYIKWFWLLFAGGFAGLLLLFLLASWGVFGALPSFAELENPENNLASEIISSDGKTLGTYAIENRKPIQFKDLPENLVNALIATEDERFFEHSGIDFRGLARAISKLGKGGGASTITQQLAKTYLPKELLVVRLKEFYKKLRNG